MATAGVSQDILRDEEQDTVGELPTPKESSSQIPRKRLNEPPTSSADPTIDEGSPKKRRRTSFGNNEIGSGRLTRSRTTPAPPDSVVPSAQVPQTQVPQTPPDNGPRTRSKTAPAPPNTEAPETPPQKAPHGLPTPESTATQDANVTAEDLNVSPAATATVGEDEEPKAAGEDGLSKTPADNSAGNVPAPVLPVGQSTPSLSSFKPAASEALALDDAVSTEEASRQPLSAPNSSPLSTPPSSPTLNAQAESFAPEPIDTIRLPVAEPSRTAAHADEQSDESNANGPSSPESTSPANNADVQDYDSQTLVSHQDGTNATPMSEALSQLPTPPSSNSSNAVMQDKFSAIKQGGRTRKKPVIFGDLVGTPAIPEEIEDRPDLDAMEIQFEPSSTKTRKVSAKSNAKTKASAAVKTKTPAKANARVTKGTKKAEIAPKASSTASSVVKARPGRPKKTQTTANVSSEDGKAAGPPRKRIRLVLPAPTTVDAVATTKAPKGQKKPSANAEAIVQTAPTTGDENITTTKTPKGQKKASPKAEAVPKTPKAPTKKIRMHQLSVTLVGSNPLTNMNLDQGKLALSQRLSKRQPLESKPEPQGQPTVWAESRQALCETLPYFKKPQGGCYSNEGHVYGFLFDGVGHCREYLDENLILCRAGGSMEADTTNGGMVQKKDQTMTESQVQSVINDMKHHNPLIVTCGNRNIAAPAKMPHQYNVLGWYKAVFVWAEKTQGKGSKVWTTIKYRLERLNQHLETAWHSPKDDALRVSDEDRAVAGPLASKVCEECGTDTPQIYLQGWMCLNPSCEIFWELNGWQAPCGKEGLDYDPAFLLHRSELWKNSDEVAEAIPGDVRPPVPKVGDIIGDNLFYVNTRGVCCPECGRCNSRRKFSGWKCENPTCSWSFSPQHRSVLPTMLHTPWDAAPTLVRNKHADGVYIESSHASSYKVSRYTFEGIKGCFLHLAATREILGEEKGANDMFAELQTVDMGLERRVFAVTKMSGARANDTEPDLIPTPKKAEAAEENLEEANEEFAAGDLMTAFSMNYGMPYKFVASGGSQSFDAAPWPVSECRRRLNWAQKTFLTEQSEYMDFNEQLIFAYLEGQKIEYHDDGESGLGPRIATFSLGGRAKMHMRMKAKHYVGCSKTGIFTEEKPVPGSIDGEEMFNKRHEKWEELQAIKHDTAAYNKRRKEIPKELGLFEKKMKKAQDLVTVTLNHGDIIIMDGYDIQKYLEHKVVPEGYLRFALTCRTVLSDHLKPGELPSYTVEEDPITYDGPKLSQTSNDRSATQIASDV